MSNDYVQRYIALHDDFIRTRNLDEDDAYWTEQDKADWDYLYKKFNEAEGRPKLL